MHHELQALTRQGMEAKIHNLETMLDAMNTDFGECAKGKSPCFFCANDKYCNDPDKYGCHFIWSKHN